DQISISNAIGSLRLLAQIDWREIFELTNRVEQLLQDDPAGVHSLSDFATRDSCRQVVEEVARYSKRPELEVARDAMVLAEEGRGEGERHHTGYYLLGAGRITLESRVGCHLPLGKSAARWVRSHPTLFYLGSVGTITAVISCLAGVWSRDGVSLATLIVVGILALFPASEIALQLVNYVVSLT